mgnify:CR=1 FL=1
MRALAGRPSGFSPAPRIPLLGFRGDARAAPGAILTMTPRATDDAALAAARWSLWVDVLYCSSLGVSLLAFANPLARIAGVSAPALRYAGALTAGWSGVLAGLVTWARSRRRVTLLSRTNQIGCVAFTGGTLAMAALNTPWRLSATGRGLLALVGIEVGALGAYQFAQLQHMHARHEPLVSSAESGEST